MKSIKEILIILRDSIKADRLHSGMCFLLWQLEDIEITLDERFKADLYLEGNAPKIMIEFYKVEKEALDIEFNDSWDAERIAREKTGHLHGGYWFERGDKESRLEWLDKHIKLHKNEEIT